MANYERPNQDAVLTRRRQNIENDSGSFISFLKGCVMCCYLMCPPTPNAITRKLAFHPPQKGHTYSICLEDGTSVSNASKVAGKRFYIKPERLTRCSTSDYEELMRRVKSFTLRTSHGSELIVIRCIPEHSERIERLSRMVIIFAQPNASDLGEYLQPYSLNIPLLAELFKTEVYAFDYSGFGFSSGTVSEKNIYDDTRAVFDYVRQRQPDKKIILLGYSIGTAAVADLASRNPDGLAGVILVAPFTSGLRLFGRKPKEENTSRLDRFTTYDKVPKIVVPVLVCHGTADEAIPVEHGLEIAKRAPRAVSPLIVHGADHMSIFNGTHLQTFKRIRRVRLLRTQKASYGEDFRNRAGDSHVIPLYVVEHFRNKEVFR